MKKKIISTEIIGPLSALIILIVIISLTTPRFLLVENFRNIFLQVSIVSLVAIGSTFVILNGGIDLSSGSMIALLTMVLATLIKALHVPVLIAILLTIALGGVMGLLNGTLWTYLRIPAFIATLATMGIFRGFAFMINEGSPIFSISDSLQYFFYGSFLNLPVVLFYIIIFYSLGFFFLKYTATGRKIHAVGGNRSSARYSGINVKFISMLSFILAGIVTGVASILMTARLNSGSPNYGVGMELSAIAACVIGGASLSGGKANVISTFIGAMIVVIVQNALNLNTVPTSIQNIVIGSIIIFAVILDMWKDEITKFFKSLRKKKSIY